MTKQNLEKVLKKQLESLNEAIDRKIVRGQSYKREAQQHKFILMKLSNLKRERMHWMVRSFSTLSLI